MALSFSPRQPACLTQRMAVPLAVLALWSAPALALVPPQAQTASPPAVPVVGKSGAAKSGVGEKTRERGRSGWAGLSASQRESLAPLAGTWNSLSAAHQRKWLALSESFPRLSPAEQTVLHSRMREWAALSTRQRAQARLNFGEARQLSPADKKALWEAYQALSPEEKKKLAAGALPKPPATAAAIRPVAKQKLATLPAPVTDARAPRIAVGPDPGGPDLLLQRPTGSAAEHTQ